jgi:uncharacterized protein YcaQ
MYSATHHSHHANARGPFATSGNTRLAPNSTRPATYDRTRDLPRLLPLWPDETTIHTQGAQTALIARLRRALRAERQRGIAGHWTYNLARHADLLRAYRAELAGVQVVSEKSPETNAAQSV